LIDDDDYNGKCNIPKQNRRVKALLRSKTFPGKKKTLDFFPLSHLVYIEAYFAELYITMKKYVNVLERICFWESIKF
jgi:hypothetical protein